MRVLVTGAAGFIGSHLVDRLLADGHDVLAIDSFVDYYPRSLKESNLLQARQRKAFRLIEGDLNELPLSDLLRDREWVFHQAAQPGVRSSWGEDFPAYLASNIAATQKLLEAAAHTRGLRRFLFASSSSVYGNVAEMPVSEDAPLDPISPYGMTKMLAERLCLLYGGSHGVPVVCLRYFTVYGPRQRPDMAFHRFGRALLAGTECTVYGDGRQSRDFTHVSDVVQANIDAATAAQVEGQVMNIAGGARVSINDAIRLLGELAGKPALVRHEPNARGDVSDTFADISLAGQLIGYRPKVGLPEGLRSEVDHLRSLYLSGRSATRV